MFICGFFVLFFFSFSFGLKVILCNRSYSACVEVYNSVFRRPLDKVMGEQASISVKHVFGHIVYIDFFTNLLKQGYEIVCI